VIFHKVSHASFDSAPGHWQDSFHAVPLQSDTFSHTPSQSCPPCAAVANLRLQGIAAACAVLARDYGEPDDAATVLNHLGLTVAVLEAAGADPYDLEPSKPNFP
jgi:hypothetical protein